jgi:phosphoglucomutase
VPDRAFVTAEASPNAGHPADPAQLVDVSKLVAAYYAERPDPAVPAERVAFGTSGHRGSSFDRAFNEWHILAITQAICERRRSQSIDGPLFIGRDTHALSEPAFGTALEVLAANGVETMTAGDEIFTPTPAVSHAILTHNRGRISGLADGIVVTPSHNPPEDGGFKYNPPHGGPAEETTTTWIEARANELLAGQLTGVRRVPVERARRASTTRAYGFREAYVGDLGSVLDLDVVARSGLRLGVDPLGGAGVHYWPAIVDRYGINLTVISEAVDPTFAFMTLDWDGRIRMDPSSAYAMQRLIGLKDRFDIAFACDTDHDRHGIVTRSSGLLPPNHYLTACVHYLFTNRPRWSGTAAIGKTVVSSSSIDRAAAAVGRQLSEMPVGFKWFVDGLRTGELAFAGEESAGATFARLDGTVWTTDKDGITAALLAAEITARAGHDPGELYHRLTRDLGNPVYARIEVPANAAEKRVLEALSEADLHGSELAGEPIQHVLTVAPGNQQPIGGIKVVGANGWFAARPSGTEPIYKIYAESFRGEAHLQHIEADARAIVAQAIARRRTATDLLPDRR